MAPKRTAKIALPKKYRSGASGNILSGRKCVKNFNLNIVFPPPGYLFQPQKDLLDKKKTEHPLLGLICEPSSNSYIPAKPTWQIQHEFERKVCDNQLYFSPSNIHQLFFQDNSARMLRHSIFLQKCT